MSVDSPSPIEQEAAEAMSISDGSQRDSSTEGQEEIAEEEQKVVEETATESPYTQEKEEDSEEGVGDTSIPMKQQALADVALGLESASKDSSQNEPAEGAKHTPYPIQQKAAEAIAILGFEALYQDDFEDGAMGGYMSDSSDANSVASTTIGDLLFGNPPEEQDMATIADYGLESRKNEKRPDDSKAGQRAAAESSASRGSVAWFHQQRIEKEKKRTRRVEIIMQTDDVVAKRVATKRKGSFSTADTTISSGSAHDPKLQRPLKRRTISMKMKGWLQSHRSDLTNTKRKVELGNSMSTSEEPKPPPPNVQKFNPDDHQDPPIEEIEVEPMIGKQRRLTIVSDNDIDRSMSWKCIVLPRLTDLGSCSLLTDS